MTTPKHFVSEKSNRLESCEGRIRCNHQTEFARLGNNSLQQTSRGVAFKASAKHPIRLGFVLVFLHGSLLGQVASPSQANRGATTVVASPAQPLAQSNDLPDHDSFVIGNEDILVINVWKEPDLSRSIQVRPDGKISLPLLGEVQAAGRTPLQLEKDIFVKLQNYITKPQVTVIIEQVNSKKINILGQVTKPGSYPLALAPTVVDAIAIAGGPRDFAKEKSVYILRQNPGGEQSRINFNYKDYLKGRNQNIKLEAHDTVVVP
jgi:polysaccharide export outer membrane protein